MAIGNVGQIDTSLPKQDDAGLKFDTALSGALQNEWTRREEARDQAKAAGNEALAQHFQMSSTC